jgi:putative transcriptional regulator
VVFVGGPVSPEVAVGLERTIDPDRSTSLDGVGLVDFDLDDGTGGPVRVYAGYAGWGPGQLEDELEEGAWAVVDAHPDDPFVDRPSDLWRLVLRRTGGRMALLSTYPPDPELN